MTAVLLLARAVRGQSAAAISCVQDLPGHTTPIDLEAFRNLIDPGEENFLRRNLPPAEFKRIQRERMWAAIAYIHSASQNAAILLRLGEAARRSPEASLVTAGQQLVETAIRLRFFAILALLKLYLALLLPGLRLSPLNVVVRYERLTYAVARFTRLQQPTQATRISLNL